MLDLPQGSPGPCSEIVGEFLPEPEGRIYSFSESTETRAAFDSLSIPSHTRALALQDLAEGIAEDLSRYRPLDQFEEPLVSKARDVSQLILETGLFIPEESSQINRLSESQASYVFAQIARRIASETTLGSLTPEFPVWAGFARKLSSLAIGKLMIRTPPIAHRLAKLEGNQAEGAILSGSIGPGVMQISARALTDHWFLHSFANPEKFSTAFSTILHEFIHDSWGHRHIFLAGVCKIAGLVAASYYIPLVLGVPHGYAQLLSLTLCGITYASGKLRVFRDMTVVTEAQSWSAELLPQIDGGFEEWVQDRTGIILHNYFKAAERDVLSKRIYLAVRTLHALRLFGISESELAKLVARTRWEKRSERWKILSDRYDQLEAEFGWKDPEMFEALLDARHLKRQLTAYEQFLKLREITLEEVASCLALSRAQQRVEPSHSG